MPGEQVTHDFKVTRFQGPRILVYFLQVGEHAPLADFMAYDGNVPLLHIVAIVGSGREGFRPEAHRFPAIVRVDPGMIGYMILTFSDHGPPGRRGIEAARIFLFPAGNEFAQERLALFAAGLVAVGQEPEGGMVSVGIENTVALVDNVGIQRVAVTGMCPERPLHMKQEAHPVTRDKSGFRRAPRMEAQMIQTVIFRRTEYLHPGFHIRGRIPGARKNGTFQRAAQKDTFAVQDELGAVHPQFAHTENHLPAVHILRFPVGSRQLDFQDI
ncbi:MAG: hypothetical protein BWY09_02495 [Candidatus Hydrogenedentes bacterium ADurb.Bin179]|nr:MAG: hypothetical protein BWY09_02495 [Candidatus Hydrogenedentes bacterium ADurb.Bin179]